MSEIEAAPRSWLDGHSFSSELDALASNTANLTDEERRGCIAEIIAHRFHPTTPADRGPWDSYFGPTSSGTDQNGNEVYIPDAKQIDAEIIEYWKVRSVVV
ncbi:hypothetical protein D3871_13490 [Noviherbaspirillum saxi]|uniref:Uncharacterized protein n=1 Tax=Noviherbaspirillum saxi TaxID=2320863 RepID=A0A3A3FUF2_9BURK|nr:hypothetical protein D3871_13490 [Noviherbaspirillum saxi]